MAFNWSKTTNEIINEILPDCEEKTILSTLINRRASSVFTSNVFQNFGLSEAQKLLLYPIVKDRAFALRWESWTSSGYVPNYFNRCAESDRYAVIMFRVSRNINDTFAEINHFRDSAEYNQFCTEEDKQKFKTMELLLMESRFHKVRVIKLNKNLLIFSNKDITADMRTKALASLLAVFPELNNTLPEDLKDYIKCIADTEEEINNVFKTIIENYFDLGEEAERAKQELIEQFATVYKREEEQINNNISRLRQQLSDYQESIYSLNARLAEEIIHLEACRMDSKSKQEKLTEIVTYWRQRSAIKTISVDEGKIVCRIEAPVIYYNKDEAVRVLSNPNNRFNWLSSQKWYDQFIQIIIDTFINEKFTMYFTEDISIGLRDCSLRELHNDYNIFYNPHLRYYNCWGNSITEISKAIRNSDLIMAIEQIIAGVGSLNFLDGTVIGRWTENLPQLLDYKCLECKEDGQMYTLKEAMEKFTTSEEQVTITEE